jgi:hypothetical protein
MELVNQTAVPAQLLVADMPDEGCRGGLLVAKATFDFSAGLPRLDSADPLPVLAEPAPLGDVGELPEDLVPREDPAFEVLLLGACHPPGGRPAREAAVALSLGAVARRLLVTGDRAWVGHGPSATIGPPAEFMRMPLSYERAFGGSAEIRIDPHSTYPVFEPLNARGRGFDAEEYLAGCAAAFECPSGFPVLSPAPRLLPNLEDPERRIRAWADHPPPACWATIPRDVGFGARALSARLARYGPRATRAQQAQAAYFRAHPDWTLDAPPPARALLRLEGARPQGPIAFALPSLRVLADYEIGSRFGTLELLPQALVVVAEQLRFYLVYRRLFRFDAAPGQARSFRLRLAEGWAPEAA